MALALLLLSSTAIADPCVDKLPPDLRQLLLVRFPHERLPSSSDTPADAYPAGQTHPDKCLLVARADVDGDGRDDMMLVLPSKSQRSYRLVAAVHRAEGWRIDALGSWRLLYHYMYVDVASPGLYKHTNDYPYTPGEGGVERFDAKHPGFEFGKIEAQADDYFFDGHRWLYVHAID